MDRATRRAAYHQLKKVTPGAQWESFTYSLVKAMPRFVYWTGLPYPVRGHVYTHCAVLAAEWAGSPNPVIRFRPFARARAVCAAMCRPCWDRWLAGERLS